MAQKNNRIAGITVSGFKSICTKQSIEIKPLTILAGANSSGKSSFMQPLLLLKQTLEAAGDPGALRLDGVNVLFTSADQLLSQLLGKERCSSFRVRIDLLEKESLEIAFKRMEGRGIEVERMIYTAGPEHMEIVPGMSHEEIIKILPPPWKTFHQDIGKHEKNASLKWTVSRERCFLSFELTSTEEPKRRISFGPHGISPS